MIFFGYFLAMLIGISLSITGSGGAILTMPLLVYLFDIDPTLATSYTLLIVGVVSLIGAIKSYQNGVVDTRAVLLFGSSSFTTVFLIRTFLVPIIPAHTIAIKSLHLNYSDLTMILFAVFMLFSSFVMLQNRSFVKAGSVHQKHITFRLVVYGIGLGVMTGFLGIGGGFMIIPALVLLLQMPMKKAIGTSLSIITLNSFIGFFASVGSCKIDWPFVSTVIIIALSGLIFGTALSKKWQNETLKKVFGCLVLAIGIGIIFREALIH